MEEQPVDQDNEAVIQRLFSAVERREITPMYDIYDPQVTIREAASLPYGGEYRGHDGMQRHAMAYLQTWGPVQHPEDRDLDAELLGSGDRVVVRWRQRAHRRDGQRLDLPAVSIYRLNGGKVVEAEMFHSDTAALLNFLGPSDP